MLTPDDAAPIVIAELARMADGIGRLRADAIRFRDSAASYDSDSLRLECERIADQLEDRADRKERVMRAFSVLLEDRTMGATHV